MLKRLIVVIVGINFNSELLSVSLVKITKVRIMRCCLCDAIWNGTDDIISHVVLIKRYNTTQQGHFSLRRGFG